MGITGIVGLCIDQDNRRKSTIMKNPETESRNKPCRNEQPETTSLETNPKLVSKPSDTTSRDATTSFLLKILTNEIARDGGACLVTTLKDYIIDDANGHRQPLNVSLSPLPSTHPEKLSGCCNKSKKSRNQQLNSLLRNSNVGKPKLLAFLESHPDIFNVNRNTIPHWVQLVTTSKMPVKGQPSLPNTHTYPLHDSLRTKLFQKALYVLRKREARIDRRKKKNESNLVGAAGSDNTLATDINERTDSGVYCHWLLRQCSWELHFLLRYCGFYQDSSLCGYETPSDVKQVGSREWEDITLPIFERLLRTGKCCTSCGRNDGERMIISWIQVQGGKAVLRQSCSDEEYRKELYIDGNDEKTKMDVIVRSFYNADEGEIGKGCEEEKLEISKNHDTDENDAMLNLVRRIDQTLTEIVCRKDGGHQVTLQLLLHRYPQLKEILGGRDLWTLYCDFSGYENDGNGKNNTEKDTDSSGSVSRSVFFFQSVSMFYDGTNIIVRSKQSKTIECDGGNDNHIKKDSCGGKRMKVDEEGLYSVTNNKWGRAMTNLVIQACRQTNLFGGEKDSVARVKNHEQEFGDEEVESSCTSSMVIDLTASVGGMTLALARSSFFDSIVALEIEKVRADLCRENLSRHGFHDVRGSTNGDRNIVEVRHEDSVRQIPFLPRRVCFVIDPPWGGFNYKEKVRRQQEQGKQLLKLGDTPLEDVLAMISHHNSPCVVGLRLPTNFALKDFLNALRKNDQTIEFECLTTRKISVQLFVVLYFPPPITVSKGFNYLH